MSINLSIKGVPELIAERLRTRAERNHRSLQGELMAIVERAASEGDDAAGDVSRQRPESIRRGTQTIEDLVAERRLRYPRPVQGGPLAVDIIRQDRDSR